MEEAQNLRREQIESINETQTNLLSDVCLAKIEETELVVNNHGFCYNYDELQEMVQKARRLIKIIDKINATYDKSEFDNWRNLINDERLLIYKQQQQEIVSLTQKNSAKTANTFVYLMLNEHTGSYKIGRADNPTFREKTLQSEEPHITMVVAYPGKRSDELYFHKLFANKRLRGEWFRLEAEDVLHFHEYFK